MVIITCRKGEDHDVRSKQRIHCFKILDSEILRKSKAIEVKFSACEDLIQQVNVEFFSVEHPIQRVTFYRMVSALTI